MRSSKRDLKREIAECDAAAKRALDNSMSELIGTAEDHVAVLKKLAALQPGHEPELDQAKNRLARLRFAQTEGIRFPPMDGQRFPSDDDEVRFLLTRSSDREHGS